MLLTSGYQAASTNRAQSQLGTPSIKSIDNSMSRQLDVHLTPIVNAMGYEMQTLIGTGEWTTVKYSPQARSSVAASAVTAAERNPSLFSPPSMQHEIAEGPRACTRAGGCIQQL